MRRREFTFALAGTVAASLAYKAAWAATSSAAPSALTTPKAAKPLRILMLGGTRFIGIHMTELALARGHSVTFFNRGRTGTELFPQVERILGDRDGKLEGLNGKQWDAVIDNSGYVPRHVRLSAEKLASQTSHYVFISSISVYPDFSVPRDESSPVGKLTDETVEKVDGETYGPLKALCEQAAEKAMPGKVTVLRPGLIVGPEDNTDRFTYWPARAERGGDMACPNKASDRVQIIDARDLAAFTLRTIEQRTMGVFNLVSPPNAFTIGDVVDSSIGAARLLVPQAPPARAVWIPASFLDEQKVSGWNDLPVWMDAKGEEAAFSDTSVARALAAGLQVRPIALTTRDTLAWHLTRPEEERRKLKTGLDADREADLLKKWRARA